MYPTLRIDTATLNWLPLRPRSCSKLLRRACLKIVSGCYQVSALLGENSRDIVSVEIIEEVKQPDHGQESKVQLAYQTLLIGIILLIRHTKSVANGLFSLDWHLIDVLRREGKLLLLLGHGDSHSEVR